ncbi:TIGR04255 family protein [Cupriavidus sp. UYPR2.512]|uniref:TIGR04255 family protein n=1 Tax=Cupriavidus sp. UYPR2.512 TaxID=1080187 RepID=UPI0009DA59B1|nr:TIGR04255 family protein [Cupriavidus sp. UYPR2.512]UIF88420.1 TIGR04255 family protein [Cupriavidus necator]
MGKPLKNPPVYFTLAQVRFNALLKLSEYLPSIQDGLRRTGFPAFSTHSNVVLQFSVQEGQAVPQPVPQVQYLFANVEQTHSFVLSPESLTFQSTNYGTYESFSGAFLKGLSLVHDLVNLDFTERVGLRYLDHVFPKHGDPLERYLAPQVQGLGDSLGGQALHTFVEMFNAVGDTRLRARVLTQDGSLAFPPDLLPHGMIVQPRFSQARGKHAILDTDGFIEGRKLFSLEGVGNSLGAIHDVIGAAFRRIITPHALAVWDE